MKNEKIGTKIPLGELNLCEKIRGQISGIDMNFAIKLFDPHPFQKDYEMAYKRFVQEAQFLFELRHPHITPIYGIGEYEDKPYIIMEYFEGLNLNQVKDKFGSPNPQKILNFIESIVDAIGYAHKCKIIHRDIKPSNLLTKKGDARVLDFGIAKILDPSGERLTRTGGTIMGDTFSAPEFIDNPKKIDHRCDIYSLGACWFWLLTGCSPKGVNWEDAIRKNSDVTQEYESVILRCLNQVELRYQSMDELISNVKLLRTGHKPELSEKEIGDNDLRLIIIIANNFLLNDEGVGIYQIEQEIRDSIPRILLGISIRKLIRLQLISKCKLIDHEYNNEEYKGLELTESGMKWIDKNQNRIEEFIKEDNQKKLPHQDIVENDDIPF